MTLRGRQAIVAPCLGNGTFAPAISYAAGTNPQSVAIADLDGDGRRDLITANIGSNAPQNDTSLSK